MHLRNFVRYIYIYPYLSISYSTSNRRAGLSLTTPLLPPQRISHGMYYKEQSFHPFLHFIYPHSFIQHSWIYISISTTQEIQCLIICCYKLSYKHVCQQNQQQYNQKHTAHLQQSLHITNLYTPNSPRSRCLL